MEQVAVMNDPLEDFILSLGIDTPGSEAVSSGRLKIYSKNMAELLKITASIIPEIDTWLSKAIDDDIFPIADVLEVLAACQIHVMARFLENPEDALRIFKNYIEKMEEGIKEREEQSSK